jgi:hypothetical protein
VTDSEEELADVGSRTESRDWDFRESAEGGWLQLIYRGGRLLLRCAARPVLSIRPAEVKV